MKKAGLPFMATVIRIWVPRFLVWVYLSQIMSRQGLEIEGSNPCSAIYQRKLVRLIESPFLREIALTARFQRDGNAPCFVPLFFLLFLQ